MDELFKLLQIFIKKYPDSTDQEIIEINQHRRETIQLYLSHLDGKAGWGTLIPVAKILLENDEDKLFFIHNRGLELSFDVIIYQVIKLFYLIEIYKLVF